MAARKFIVTHVACISFPLTSVVPTFGAGCESFVGPYRANKGGMRGRGRVAGGGGAGELWEFTGVTALEAYQRVVRKW